MLVLLVVAAYLLGSVPSGVLLARRAGVDPRRGGSGNIGATNVARLAGARFGAATLLADVAKGVVAVLLARAAGASPGVEAAAGVAAVLGHVFPPWLGFRGGKGVATALGVLIVLAPAAALVSVAAFALVLALARRVSAASLAAATAAPGAVAIGSGPVPATFAALAIAIVIALRHRDNVRRLLSGTEPHI